MGWAVERCGFAQDAGASVFARRLINADYVLLSVTALNDCGVVLLDALPGTSQRQEKSTRSRCTDDD